MKINFDAWLTIQGERKEPLGETWCWHFFPRATLFVNPISKTNEQGHVCNVGRQYELQIGWLCFEVSISVERRTRWTRLKLK